MRRGWGWEKAPPEKVMQSWRPRPDQRGPRGQVKLAGFYSKSSRGSSDRNRGMPRSDFHFGKDHLAPWGGGSPDGGGAEVLLRSRLAVRVAWTKLKALETGKEMKRERLT